LDNVYCDFVAHILYLLKPPSLNPIIGMVRGGRKSSLFQTLAVVKKGCFRAGLQKNRDKRQAKQAMCVPAVAGGTARLVL
jgi:hypothetical protein